jgi:TatD DNase family protein
MPEKNTIRIKRVIRANTLPISPIMIDTHSHIYLADFYSDRDEVIARAKQAGVSHIILPNIDSSSTQAVLSLASSEPDFFHPAMGLHPTSVKADFEQELAHVEQQLRQHNFCAIGEIGMDLYWDKSFLEEQKIAFKQQLSWAIEYKLPVIIHVRDAFQETLTIIRQYNCPELRGIFHSFSGSLNIANEIIALGGFKLGINGVVTFNNAKLPQTLAKIPLENIVLETDAPFLTPAPFRGKRNEPAYLSHITNKLAEIYFCSQEKIIKKTTENSQEIFKTITFA